MWSVVHTLVVRIVYCPPTVLLQVCLRPQDTDPLTLRYM